MSIDLDRPSIEAADEIDLFRTYDAQKGHPAEGDSWTRAVVTKIIEDQSHRHTVARGSDLQMLGGIDRSRYTADELAAYDWYRSQTEPGRWKELVFEHRQKDAREQVEPPEEFNPDRNYREKPVHAVEGLNRKPFDGQGGRAGAVAVSTDAILYFANVLESIAPIAGGNGPLQTVIDKLKEIKPRPGAFSRAEKYRLTLVPDLQGETTKTVGDLQAILGVAQTELRALVKEYDTAEELNGLTVKQYGDVMTGSNTRIDALGAPATKEKT
ncbi:hypothetical protein [Micromonospora profundi]|uniref:Uncharacterized protein n=1 Tax=Micromonospora profundi TaxID=1420889 RepID=A0AAJ6L2H9_9ACTN|nr:hypothetical protein [Micromonospora profundi]WLS43441.1 hypothetical protein Q3V37_18740 [Micromonospora profundi]